MSNVFLPSDIDNSSESLPLYSSLLVSPVKKNQELFVAISLFFFFEMHPSQEERLDLRPEYIPVMHTTHSVATLFNVQSSGMYLSVTATHAPLRATRSTLGHSSNWGLRHVGLVGLV